MALWILARIGTSHFHLQLFWIVALRCGRMIVGRFQTLLLKLHFRPDSGERIVPSSHTQFEDVEDAEGGKDAAACLIEVVRDAGLRGLVALPPG